MEKDREKLDDLFRSKLQDFEADTMPGDWEAISNRLPGKVSVPFRRTLRYWAAAAVISLLMITSSVYMLYDNQTTAPVAEKIEQETKNVEKQLAKEIEKSQPVAEIITPSVPVAAANRSLMRSKNIAALIRTVDTEPVVVSSDDEMIVSEEEEVMIPVDDSVVVDTEEVVQAHPETGSAQIRSQVADAAPVANKPEKASSRKWGFGMGGGSVTAGTSNSLSTYAFKNTSLQDKELLFLNSAGFDKQTPRTNIHHKTPISVGFSVSRSLNNRFALLAGLNYSFLSSSWETNGDYHSETKQKLHFIGIPVSLSYKIAEWNRFQFYAAAGGMGEVNVAGKLDTKIFSGRDEFRRERNPVRMKEWLWSVNARVGVSYPLLRFVSVYAEAGADYYFDNGSKIETVRSEKPFNVNLQAGFRLGF